MVQQLGERAKVPYAWISKIDLGGSVDLDSSVAKNHLPYQHPIAQHPAFSGDLQSRIAFAHNPETAPEAGASATGA